MVRLVLPVLVFLAWTPAARAWSWPVQGSVLQPFVYDEAHPYASGQHRGVDIGAAAAGVPVVAPAGGTVSFAGSTPANGRSLTIETPDGYSVTLTHLGSILVVKDATVAEGDAVGTVGPSGTPEVGGPYVHLGIRAASDPSGYVDPLGLLPPAAESAPTENDAPSTQPSASGGSSGSTASEPPPAVAATTRETTVRGSRARVSRRGRGSRAPASRPQATRPRSSERPAVHARVPADAMPRPHAKSGRRPSEPTSRSQRPVVEAAAPREPAGLDAGHQPQTAAHGSAQPRKPGPGTSAVLLPLGCNCAAALLALAAAVAAARRRRRGPREETAHAEVLHLPRPALDRRERRAA